MGECCNVCRFISPGISNPRCRRYPPDMNGQWPKVRIEWWCGEYQTRESKEPEKRSVPKFIEPA